MRAVLLFSIAVLLILPSGEPLRCYTCLFPMISPMECLKFTTICGPSQKCLTSVTRGHKGALNLVIKEKSCGDPSMCQTHGIRPMFGTNFTYYISCCSTDLCNGAHKKPHMFWGLLTFAFLSFIVISFS